MIKKSTKSSKRKRRLFKPGDYDDEFECSFNSGMNLLSDKLVSLDSIDLTYKYTRFKSSQVNIFPFNAKEGVTQEGLQLFKYRIFSKERSSESDKPFAFILATKPFYTKLLGGDVVVKASAYSKYAIIGVENATQEIPEHQILVFRRYQLVTILPTKEARQFEIYQAPGICGLGLCHFYKKGAARNLKSRKIKRMRIHWLYKLRDKIVVSEVHGIPEVEIGARMAKLDNGSLMLISRNQILTYGRGKSFDSHFSPTLFGSSRMFGVYASQRITGLDLSDDLELMLLEIFDSKNQKFFHSIYNLRNLNLVSQLDSTLSKSWKQEGRYMKSGLWTSEKGYFLRFLTLKNYGLFFVLSKISGSAHRFLGTNHCFLLVDIPINQPTSFKLNFFEFSGRGDQVSFLSYYPGDKDHKGGRKDPKNLPCFERVEVYYQTALCMKMGRYQCAQTSRSVADLSSLSQPEIHDTDDRRDLEDALRLREDLQKKVLGVKLNWTTDELLVGSSTSSQTHKFGGIKYVHKKIIGDDDMPKQPKLTLRKTQSCRDMNLDLSKVGGFRKKSRASWTQNSPRESEKSPENSQEGDIDFSGEDSDLGSGSEEEDVRRSSAGRLQGLGRSEVVFTSSKGMDFDDLVSPRNPSRNNLNRLEKTNRRKDGGRGAGDAKKGQKSRKSGKKKRKKRTRSVPRYGRKERRRGMSKLDMDNQEEVCTQCALI